MNNEQTINQTKIQKLNDDQLVKYLDKLFSYERKLNQVIILALGEIQERRLYAYLGYASLFEMLVKHFKLSETAAYQRLNALKLIKAVPEVHGMIESGNLSLTNAAMAQSVIQKIEKTEDKKLTVQQKHEIVHAVCNKTQKQAQVALTEIHPVACLPKTIEKPITAELTQIQIILNKETHEKLQTLKSLYSHKIPDGDLNTLFELLISSAVQNHPLNKQTRKNGVANDVHSTEAELSTSSMINIENENQVTELTSEVEINREKNNSASSSDREDIGINQCPFHENSSTPLKMNNSIHNTDLSKTHAQSHTQSLEHAHYRNKYHVCDSDQPCPEVNSQLLDSRIDTAKNFSSSSSTKINNKKYVRLTVKRNIYQRANGQCEFINEQGHRCQSRHQLEFDHIQSVSHGGDSEIENLQLLCRFHNQLKVKHTHGFLYNPAKK